MILRNTELPETAAGAWPNCPVTTPCARIGGAGRHRRPCPASATGASEHAGRETEERAEKLEHAIHRDAQEAEGEKEQPDNRIEDERQKGDRPAEDE